MKHDKTVAIVLSRVNYGESDRILNLITPIGRRSAIAKGSRKQRSKLAGGIELLSESEVVLGRGGKDLNILISARMKRFFNNILHDYERMSFAYEAVKAVNKASVYIDEPEWYEVILQTLEKIDDLNMPLSLVKAWFYIRYSSLCGYELSLWRDVAGLLIAPEAAYVYDVSEKGLRRDKGGSLSSAHIKILRLLSTKSLDVISQVGGMDAYISEVALLARQHASLD